MYTIKQVKNNLNRICPGLGDAWFENQKIGWPMEKHYRQTKYSSLGRAMTLGFSWKASPEGYSFWVKTQIFIIEMEMSGIFK